MAKKNQNTLDLTAMAVAANGGGSIQTEENSAEERNKKVKDKHEDNITEAPVGLPELPKNFQEKFFDSILSYDRSPDKGRPVYVSSDILDRLQQLSERHYKRLALRTLVQAILGAFLSYDTDKAVDKFLEKINFQVPSSEKIEARRVAAEKARQRRAAEKGNKH